MIYYLVAGRQKIKIQGRVGKYFKSGRGKNKKGVFCSHEYRNINGVLLCLTKNINGA